MQSPNQKSEAGWCDVGTFNTNSALFTEYYQHGSVIDPEYTNLTLQNLPDYRACGKVRLEPGTIYRLRVAAVNQCGRGPWSEVTAFKTYSPGFPEAPSSVKIHQSAAGVHISWNPPKGGVTDYSVCMAIKPKIVSAKDSIQTVSNNLTFLKVYTGVENNTIVPFSEIDNAYIDHSLKKPMIIFRIAARNDKGFGPAIQAKWVQDPASMRIPQQNDSGEDPEL